MNLDDQLRAVLTAEADLHSAAPPDVSGLISGGRARRRRRNTRWTAGAVLTALVVAGGGYGVAQLGDDRSRSTDLITTEPPQAEPTALPQTDLRVPLEPGTYRVSDNSSIVAPVSLTVPDGWSVEHGNAFSKGPDQPGSPAIDTFVLDRVRLTDDACKGPETLGEAQSGVADLVAALRAQASGPRVSEPVTTNLGGLPATRIDLDYPGDRPLRGCRLSEEFPYPGEGALQLWSGYMVLLHGESASVYVMDMGGRQQVVATRVRDEASDADRAELLSVLGSISFETGAP